MFWSDYESDHTKVNPLVPSQRFLRARVNALSSESVNPVPIANAPNSLFVKLAAPVVTILPASKAMFTVGVVPKFESVTDARLDRPDVILRALNRVPPTLLPLRMPEQVVADCNNPALLELAIMPHAKDALSLVKFISCEIEFLDPIARLAIISVFAKAQRYAVDDDKPSVPGVTPVSNQPVVPLLCTNPVPWVTPPLNVPLVRLRRQIALAAATPQIGR